MRLAISIILFFLRNNRFCASLLLYLAGQHDS